MRIYRIGFLFEKMKDGFEIKTPLLVIAIAVALCICAGVILIWTN